MSTQITLHRYLFISHLLLTTNIDNIYLLIGVRIQLGNPFFLKQEQFIISNFLVRFNSGIYLNSVFTGTT